MLRRNRLLLRRFLGVILGLAGAIIVIEFIPLQLWYILLFSLIIIFFLVLFLTYN